MRSALCLVPLLLAACAGEQWHTQGGSALLTRAQTRAVTSTQVSQVAADGRPVPMRITCAEPSPDAVVASTAQLAASLSSNLAGVGGRTNDLQAALALGVAQQVGYVGMRTATIQAIRDLGYRLCEAYANGLLSKDEFKQIIGGTDGILLGMHAIDALGGVQRPGAVVLGQQIGTQAEVNARPRAGSGGGSGSTEGATAQAAATPSAPRAGDVVLAATADPPPAASSSPAGRAQITAGAPPAAPTTNAMGAPDAQALAAIAAEIRRIVCVTVQQGREQGRTNGFVADVCRAAPVPVAAAASRGR